MKPGQTAFTRIFGASARARDSFEQISAGPYHLEGADNIDGIQIQKVLRGNRFHITVRRESRGPGIVEKSVDATERRCSGRDPSTIGIVRYVALNDHGRRAQRLDPARGFLCVGLVVSIVDEYRSGSLAIDLHSDGAPQSCGSPGHDDHETFELPQHPTPSAAC
jgi:hypothetical protein